jgi:molybdopterin-containing oxidoreductase family iron-sulfur binding subunit
MGCDVSRRKFLKICGATIGAAVLGSTIVSSKELLSATAGRTKYAMAIDLELCENTHECDGINACVHACKLVNITPPNSYWMMAIESEHITFAERLPRPCMQCDNPPCVKVCPVGATFKRVDGIILVDYFRCIGCRLCAVACPYGVRYFNWKKPTKEEIDQTRADSWSKVNEVWEKAGKESELDMGLINNPPIELPRPHGVIEKCNFCVHRVEKDMLPACAVACPSGAIKFGNIGDPTSEISQILHEVKYIRLLEEFNTKPNVFYYNTGD